MGDPVLGKDAVVKKGSTEIGYATNVRIGVDIDLIKEYKIGDADPAVLLAGPHTFPVSIEKMSVDTEYGSMVEEGDTFSLEVSPEGTAIGKTKITVGNIIATSWELTITAEGVTMESVDGEGKSITFAAHA